MSKLRQSDPT